MKAYRFQIPASFFGIILGVAGLGNCWRTAPNLWRIQGWIGETIMMISAAERLAVARVRREVVATRRILPLNRCSARDRCQPLSV